MTPPIPNRQSSIVNVSGWAVSSCPILTARLKWRWAQPYCLPPATSIRRPSSLRHARSLIERRPGNRPAATPNGWTTAKTSSLICTCATHLAHAGFAPTALVYFRPRTSLRAFFKQYYLYARGDGKANLWLKRHLIRYATYLIAFPLIMCGIVLAQTIVLKIFFAAALVLGIILYTCTPYRRLAGVWGPLTALEKAKAVVLVPIIRVVGDVAKMIGYPAGGILAPETLKYRPVTMAPAK